MKRFYRRKTHTELLFILPDLVISAHERGTDFWGGDQSQKKLTISPFHNETADPTANYTATEEMIEIKVSIKQQETSGISTSTM